MKLRINILVFAISIFVNGIVSGQTNAFISAKVAFENKQYQKSVDLLNRHLLSFPKHSEALKVQAESYIELKNYQLALDNLSKIKISEFDDINLLFARAYAGLLKSDLAVENLIKYLNTSTKLPEPMVKSFTEFQILKTDIAWVNLWKTDKYSNKEIILNNAKYAIKSGNIAEAKDRLDEYLVKFNRTAEAYYLRGNIYFINKEYKMALDCFDKALNIDPKELEYMLARAKCCNKLGKNKTGLEIVNTIIKSDSLFISAYCERAQSLVELGEYEQAKADIVKYRLYYPENKEARSIEAYIGTKSGDFLSAIANYGQLIKSDPGQPDYFIARANAYMVTKTYKYAIKDYSMALDLNPKNIQVLKLKAKAHQLAGEMTEACYEWQHAANLGDVESMDNLHKYCK